MMSLVRVDTAAAFGYFKGQRFLATHVTAPPSRQLVMSQQLPSVTRNTSATQMALSLLESGNYHQALQVFQQVPDSDRTPDDWVNQAVCLLHLEQPEAALPICSHALELDADHPQAWLFKGVALYRLGQHDEAYACYAQAAAIADQQDQQPPQHAQGLWARCWQTLKNVAKRRS